MKKAISTRILSARSSRSIEHAAQYIRNGDVVVFPTETVYGLGANALNATAVKKIFTAKGRPSDNPLIVHIADRSMLAQLVVSIPPRAQQLMDAFWPGPLTILFPVLDTVPHEVTAGLDTIAIRMPKHPVARALIARSGIPIAAPSANRSGLPSPTQAQHAWDDLVGVVPCILDGGTASIGVESTVVDVRRGVRILRQGAITAAMLKRATGITPRISTQPKNGIVRSPGQKYQHYSPRAPIYWVRASTATAPRIARALATHFAQTQHTVALLAPTDRMHTLPRTHMRLSIGKANDPKTQARRLFAALRRCDEHDIDAIIITGIHPKGIGAAVVERLERAATAIYTTLDDLPTEF